MKLPEQGVSYIPVEFWSKRPQGTPKTKAISTIVGLITELNVQIVLLKMIYRLVAGLGEMRTSLDMKGLIWELVPVVVVVVTEQAREDQGQQFISAVDHACFLMEVTVRMFQL